MGSKGDVFRLGEIGMQWTGLLDGGITRRLVKSKVWQNGTAGDTTDALLIVSPLEDWLADGIGTDDIHQSPLLINTANS
jgi:hypothetical protein